jgi:hypothetical protein
MDENQLCGSSDARGQFHPWLGPAILSHRGNIPLTHIPITGFLLSLVSLPQDLIHASWNLFPVNYLPVNSY